MPDAVGGAVATDVLEATVEMLQPGQPTRAPLARAFAAECGGPAAVLAPLARPHAETRALAIRLLAALLPRSRNDGGGPGSGTGAHASAAVGFEKFAAAPGAFVHSISSTFAGGSSGGGRRGRIRDGNRLGILAVASGPPGLFAAVAESLFDVSAHAGYSRGALRARPGRSTRPRAPRPGGSRLARRQNAQKPRGGGIPRRVQGCLRRRLQGSSVHGRRRRGGGDDDGIRVWRGAPSSRRRRVVQGASPGSSTPPPRGFFFACSKSVRTRRCARVCSNSCSGSWRARPPTRRRSSNKPGGKSGSSRAREDDPANANPGRTSGATATRTPRSAN